MENLFDNGVDVHICGACKSHFSQISVFMAHTKICSKRLEGLHATKNSIVDSNVFRPESSQTPVIHIPDDPTFADIPRLPTEISLKSYSPANSLPPVSPSPAHGASVFVVNVTRNALDEQESPAGDIVALPSQNINAVAPTAVSDTPPKDVVKFKKVTLMGVTKFRCTYQHCVFTTLYLKDLERHYRIHTGEKPYRCWVCEKSFSRNDKLKIHQMAHKGEKPFKCLECTYATNDNSSLVKHRRVHTGERPYKCQICPYASRNASQLVVHLRTHTGDTPFHCRLCHMKFKINSDLKRHLRLHTGEKPYECSFCNYRCSNKGNLNVHMKSHVSESPHQCELCEFVTPSRKELRGHERLHQARAYECLQCSYTAGSQAVLNVHLRIHSHEKPFKCQYCTFTSRQSCNVRTHIKKKHPDKLSSSSKTRKKGIAKGKGPGAQLKSAKPSCRKTFKCKVCKSGFVRIDSLRCHLRQHQAEQLLAEVQSKLQAEGTTVTPSKDSEQADTATTNASLSNEDVTAKQTLTADEPSSQIQKHPPNVTITVVPSNSPQQPTFLPNNIHFPNMNGNFNISNVTEGTQLSGAAGVNLVVSSSPVPATSNSTMQSDYFMAGRDILKDLLSKPGKEMSKSAIMNSGVEMSQSQLNTLIATNQSTPSSDLGLYQLYQMPSNMSFVTLPFLPSASTTGSFCGNTVNSLGEIDTSSLLNSSGSTLLQISGLSSNVQYVISSAPTNVNADGFS